MASQSQLSQWQVEANSAEAYERFMVPALFRAGAAQLVDHAAIRTGERVLDVGCGTGIVARTAAERVGPSGSVVGLDLNPGMLEVAAKASSGIATQIEWRQGAAEEMPLERSSFDAVLSQQAFQFFTDPDKALAEMRRVLVPGGRIGLSVLRSVEHNRTYRPLIDAFTRHGGEDLGKMMNSPFQDLSIGQLRTMVANAGFESVSVTIDVVTARFPSIPEFLQWELSSSPLGKMVASMGNDVREAITRDVSEGLRDYTDDGGVMHPLQTYLVTARA